MAFVHFFIVLMGIHHAQVIYIYIYIYICPCQSTPHVLCLYHVSATQSFNFAFSVTGLVMCETLLPFSKFFLPTFFTSFHLNIEGEIKSDVISTQSRWI